MFIIYRSFVYNSLLHGGREARRERAGGLRRRPQRRQQGLQGPRREERRRAREERLAAGAPVQRQLAERGEVPERGAGEAGRRALGQRRFRRPDRLRVSKRVGNSKKENKQEEPTKITNNSQT